MAIGERLRHIRKVIGGILTVLGLWLWWESYKMTVDWAKRHELYPLPFYVAYVPHWFAVDLAITLVIVAYIIGATD